MPYELRRGPSNTLKIGKIPLMEEEGHRGQAQARSLPQYEVRDSYEGYTAWQGPLSSFVPILQNSLDLQL